MQIGLVILGATAWLQVPHQIVVLRNVKNTGIWNVKNRDIWNK